MSAYLHELVAGVRILCTRDFWRAFAEYWHPTAVAKRLEEWAEGQKR